MSTARGDEHGGFTFRYRCDLDALPEELARRFVPLSLDDETRQFVDEAQRLRHGAWRSVAHRLLGRFMSDFDVNGLLGTYPLFLLSSAQWKALLGDAARGHLLDVGAGSGGVTEKLAPLFDDVTATETSRPMVRRLRARFRALPLDVTVEDPPEPAYDVVACLNVIDRCERPATLLARLAALVGEGGHLVLSTPLPFDPFVYRGGRTAEPEEALTIKGKRFEPSLCALVTNVLEPLGLTVVRFARAPYLSCGDEKRALYQLDDAVLLCRKRV